MSDFQGLREQILANSKYLRLPVPPPPTTTKQKTPRSPYSSSYELVIARNTSSGISITGKTPAPSTKTATISADTAAAITSADTAAAAAADVASYKALLLTPAHEGAHIRIEGPVAETVEKALQGMLEVTAGLVEEEMKRRGAEVIRGNEILDSREELGRGVLVVMRVPAEEMEMEMQGESGGDGQDVDGGDGGGAVGKVEGKRGVGRPRKAEGGGATATAAAATGAGGAAVDGEGRVVKRGRGRPKKNAG
ncbi:hypothetical protein KC318_g10553 [Hortaea werneckii]|nr:hypothetical protein KC334_g11975 [Hortaea werneckii]KAI6986722.1 hypothetical protein KC355_g10560 [Hortaea werneckii]KAI7202780.1 hypothetical protein KC324_g1578 [Hortaea werneckii]KAI7593485.1 hypothetical protein KC316_g1705 [Hortaea werneckii]KAI7659644.1 hypothetical protein KC318_g10553 [Hortaea werneckii]